MAANNFTEATSKTLNAAVELATGLDRRGGKREAPRRPSRHRGFSPGPGHR